MAILDFYYQKYQNALETWRKDKTEQNKGNLDIAHKNYLIIVEGRELLP